MGRLSKEHLWKLFSLDSLNKHLLSDPSSSELTYRTPTRHRLGAEYRKKHVYFMLKLLICIIFSIFKIIIKHFFYERQLNNNPKIHCFLQFI